MGVYIKGMDKPKRCNICPLCRYYHENGNVWYNALNVILESIPYEMRLLDSALDSIEPHKDCPLIEVKVPHGRLIDEDAFSDMWSGNHIGDEDEGRYHDAQWIYRDEVDKVPTVIESEVE